MYECRVGAVMGSSEPLQGIELIDCAKANVHEGAAIAAERCGYGNDLEMFEQQLEKAGKAIGVDIQSFNDLNISPNDGSSLTSQF
jgi:hypothetical protein